MNSLQIAHTIEVLTLIDSDPSAIYDATTEKLRKQIEDDIHDVNLVLDACGIDVPQEFWREVKVWEEVPIARLSNFVERTISRIDRNRTECDIIFNTLLRARRLLEDLTAFAGLDEAVMTGYQDT